MIAVPDFEAYRLMHQGAEALSRMEHAGIRIDEDHLKRTYQETTEKIDDLTNDLESSDIYRTWKRRFGSKSNLGSRQQLASVLFEDLGYTPTQYTDKEQISADEKHLATVDEPFVEKYLQLAKLLKLRDTYLKGVSEEVCDGYLHPSFNLNLVDTYRSSSSKPNFQNVPIRNKDIAPLIRRAFIPRDGHTLVEIDYGQLEVRISACYHHDPKMVDYIVNDGDMHLDMAVELFKLPQSKITKELRQIAKNSFVFSEFYGSYYPNVTKGIWNALERDGVMLKGRSIFEHLKAKGIHERGKCKPKTDPVKGTFEYHVKEVESRFWNERFKVYNEWKREWYGDYLKNGCFKTKTGFAFNGTYSRNEVINTPIQGSAFHCLLWSIIQLILQEFPKRKFRSLAIGQIHDSLLLDVYIPELDDVLHVVKEVMTTRLCKAWKWITVPLVIEAEMAETNWYEKRRIEI